MISISNIQRHDDLPFDEYLRMPGYSHSFLKAQRMGFVPEFKVTRKVQVGKLIDGILTDPASVNMFDPLYPVARNIAARIKEEFGFMITKFQKQVSYTADLEHEGLVMPAKFRLDWQMPDFCVVDLKVTDEKDVRGLIKYMGYQNQLWGYGMAARVRNLFIMVYSVPLRRCELIKLPEITMHNDFWAAKILDFGKVAA